MVPSLKPIRFRGVAWLVDVEDVRPNPNWDQRSDARPKAIRARLRTACTATCGSSAQAWTHRAPSNLCGSSLSAGQWGRPPVSEPEPALALGAEQCRTKSKGDR